MNDSDKLATERVRKARADLIMSHRFYGVLVSNVEPVLSRKYKTMATDGRRHFFNPDFINTLTPKQMLGVQRHESEHDARRHHTRRGNRDPKEWNICTDYAINIDLVDEGVTLPEGALVDPKYRGWSAEDIYRARELDRAREEAKRQQQQQQAGDDDADDDAQSGAEQDQDDQDEAGDQGDSPQADGDDQGDQEGDDAGDQEGASGEDGDEPSDLGNGAGGEDADDDAGDQDGDASGEAAGEPDDGEPSEGAGNGTGADGEPSDGDAEAGNGRGGSGDPGNCGEVLDAADDTADLSEADSKWERILRQAASLARGTAPGHVTREIERADKPPQDWREVLRAWIDGGCKSIETWARPNRRFVGGGLHLPGRQRDGINRVVAIIDTSGSMMDGIALEAVSVEVQAALDEGAIDELVVVYGDTRVTRVDTYHNGDEIEFDPRGGGGTELRPLFNYVRDEIEDPSLVIVFTDGYIDDVTVDEPPADVLWAYTGYPDVVRRFIETAPWGAPAIDVGSH